MTRISYKRLVEEHDAIEELAEALLRLSGAQDRDPAVLAEALARLERAVGDHLAIEDSLIYPTIMKTRLKKPAAEIEQIGAAFEALKCDWQAYLAQWTADRIAADLDGFHAASGEMIGQLGARVRLESELLYAAALQSGEISLR